MPVRNLTSTCVPNLCYGQVALEKTILEASVHIFGFIHNGTCYETETQAFCEQGLVARFVNGRNVPECVHSTVTRCEAPIASASAQLIATTRTISPSGSNCGGQGTPSEGKECLPIADFK